MFYSKVISKIFLNFKLLGIVACGFIAFPAAAASIEKPAFTCTDIKTNPDFINFESGQVRPLALSPDNTLLFVANTPANCLEIYAVSNNRMVRVSAVQVGLEPVAVAARNNTEIWVVNHLSDSISVVDISSTPHVKRTLQVGDEPRDIVFAGSRGNRAFITTAHRGQNHRSFKYEDLRKPGIGRADVWVYDADNLGAGLSGKPISILSLFTDTPRALAVSGDRRTVYAAGFLSGNQTTLMDEINVNNEQAPPNADLNGEPAPRSGLILKYQNNAWLDGSGRDWSEKVKLSLPDKDVFAIDADALSPKIIREYAHVGTVLFNMAVNPVTGSVYISNTEANNLTRFEGPGLHSSTVRGNTMQNRITVIKHDSVTPIHLNDHVDFNLPMGTGISASEKSKSLAQPLEIQVSRNGSKAYVAAFGSNKIAVIPTRQLESNSYEADASKHIIVPGGPTGLVLNSDNSRLYVYSRFDNVISVIDTSSRQIMKTVSLYNPEPEYIVKGRPFLYDANKTSSNGTGACASCHVFGDLDSLAWDLGNPDEVVIQNPLMPSGGNLLPLRGIFHPLKGPMTTQTLRGIVDSGPMHWRGDRTGTQPAFVNGKLESQAAAAFKEFNKAFVGLVGREEMLSSEDLQLFTDFGLSIHLPPNPIRNLDDSLTPAQANGQYIYFNALSDSGIATCNSCHTLNPAKRQFGTEGLMVNDGPLFSQDMKVPHFRNLYQKIGMFGSPNFQKGGINRHMGDQIRGFGFQHDGSIATLEDFLFGGGVFFFAKEEDGLNVADFLLAYETNHSPITGQQVTLSRYVGLEELARLDLLIQQAKAKKCNLEANGYIGDMTYKAKYIDGEFVSRDVRDVRIDKQFLSRSLTGAITFTCKPLLMIN